MGSRQQVGLYLLRVGLGIFMLMWGLDKIISPESTVKIFGFFYNTSITTNVAYWLGGLQVVLGLMIIVGLWKGFSYGVGLALHFFSTVMSIEQTFINPFGQNHLFIAGIPVLTGFIALYVMRKDDTHWAVSE